MIPYERHNYRYNYDKHEVEKVPPLFPSIPCKDVVERDLSHGFSVKIVKLQYDQRGGALKRDTVKVKGTKQRVIPVIIFEK